MVDEQSRFSLHYSVARPDALEAQELINVLSAINRLAIKASRTLYGSDSPASFRIVHVQPGSIDIQGIVELIAGLQPGFALFPSLTLDVENIPDLLKKWFDLLKFLKRQPPTKTQAVENGNAVQIENSNGETTIVNGNVYNTFIFNDIGRDAEKLEIPTRHGAKKLSILKNKIKISEYSTNDLSQFRPIRPKNTPIESVVDAILEVTSPVLDGSGAWRFKFGRMKLTANLLDEDFRQQVTEGLESFRHGDHLKVRLQTIQENLGSKVTTQHNIIKVIDRI